MTRASRIALKLAIATAFTLSSVACSLLLDTSHVQCKSDADCAALGADFAGNTCSADGLCTSPDAGSDAGGVDPVVEISAGHFHTCVRRASGTILCWGNNDEGQIGDGEDPAVKQIVVKPSLVIDVEHAVQLSAGEADNCVLLDDDTMKCWGANDEGQLGNGTTETEAAAVHVIGMSKGAFAAAGDAFNCGVLTSGNVLCWGINSLGQLGDGKDSSVEARSTIPVQVLGITDAKQMSIGESHACAVLASGGVVCWGHNDMGQLGMGEIDGGQPAFSNVPVAVAGISGARAVELGEKHSCARLATNELRCWGANDHGQLGGGTLGSMSATPVAVVGILEAKSVSAGGAHTCAQLENGHVLCWGDNEVGELGQDPEKVPESATPLEVPDLHGAKEVSVGNEHSCARLATGEIMCWGHNSLGQLGEATTSLSSYTPVTIPGL